MFDSEIGFLICVCLLFVCIIIILVLVVQSRLNKSKWRQIADDSYNLGMEEVSEILKNTCNKIEEDKIKLSALSDRELMIEIMLALATYGRRIDSVDLKLKCITNYKTYIDEMNAQTVRLSEYFIKLDSNAKTTLDTIDGMKYVIQETSNRIHQLVVGLGDLNDLHSLIKVHVDNLSKTENALGAIQCKLAAVVREMNSVLNVYDQAPMKKLKSIEIAIDGIIVLLEEVQNGVNEANISSGQIHKILKSSLDEYEYGGLMYRVKDVADKFDNLENNMRGVEDDISSMSGKVEDIRNSVQSSLGLYGNDIHYELDTIANGVNMILNK